MREKKKRFKLILSVINALIILLFIILFVLYTPLLAESLETYQEAWFLILILIIRIITFITFSILLYHKWFKQEAIYTSDAYFLFAIFFNIFIYGKFLDIFSYLAYGSTSVTEFANLVIIKLRYFIIISEAIPILYLGLEIFINFINIYFNEMNRKQSNRLRKIIIFIFLSILSILILIAPDTSFMIRLLPIIVFGTLLGIVVMFIFMYQRRLLSQANGLIIGLGFLLFIISSILRTILTSQFRVPLLILAEIIDMFVFFVIFYGFISKPKYSKI